MNKLISLKNVSYEINKKIILKDISLDIFHNQIIGLKGPNGAGKTTLLKVIYGLLEPSSGEVTRHYKNTICKCIIFQNPVFLNSTVYDNLEHALYCRNISKDTRKVTIKNLLKKFSLEGMSKKYIHLLSGGELQLVSLLRALVIQPKLIFYDEPTNNLDSNNTNLILDILRNCIKNDIQILLVSHDDNFTTKLNCLNINLKEGRRMPNE